MSREAPATHPCFPGKRVHGVWFLQARADGIQQCGEPTVAGCLRQGLLNDLVLSAIAVRGYNKPPRGTIGDSRAKSFTEYVQANIQARRGSGRGQDIAIVDVEYVWLHMNRREAPGELVHALPVSRRTPSLEQTCRRKYVSAETQTNKFRAAIVRTFQRREQSWGRRIQLFSPTRHDDGIGCFENFDRREIGETESCGRPDFAGFTGAYHDIENARGCNCAEHERRYRQMERNDAMESNHSYRTTVGTFGHCRPHWQAGLHDEFGSESRTAKSPALRRFIETATLGFSLQISLVQDSGRNL